MCVLKVKIRSKNKLLKKVIFLIALFLFCDIKIYAQAQNWCLGDFLRIEFTPTGAIPRNTILYAGEAVSSTSDPITGELLMSSNGIEFRNKLGYGPISGTGILGHKSSTMGALIIPQPGNPNIYYLFTTDAYQNRGMNGFRYTVLDYSVPTGYSYIHGEVTSKNNLLFAPCAEVNHAVIHSNCRDYWVMARSTTGNSYYAYLLTDHGVEPPVVSNIGIPTDSSGWGQSKFSPNGKKFATAQGQRYIYNYLQLFDFNTTTGMLSNPITLSYTNTESIYGVSFSPDNTKLYATMGNIYSTQLFQYDITLGSAAAIIASKTFIADCPSWFPQIQNAIDGKIYVSADGTNYIQSINNPNATGTSCNYNLVGISWESIYPSTLSYGKSGKGLPVFPENYFDQNNPNSISSFSSDTTIDYGTSVQLWVNGTGGWVEWSPASTLSCSNCINPIASPLENTTYTVSYSDGVHCPVIRTITVKLDYNPVVPNVFTPNNDGQNDLFQIIHLPPGSKLKIYNRWGNLEYITDDYMNDWTTNIAGTYYYILELSTSKILKGFVEVITD